LEQNEQLQLETSSGALSISNCVAPQWQRALRGMDVS
jgi:hypothetical protein